MISIQERLINCFAVTFPDLSESEIPRASTASVAAWDSLATVTLISLIEEEFKVSITPDDFESLVSFELIRECLESKIDDV